MSDVKEFGARGDGRADDTEAILEAVNQGDGLVALPRGRYRITRPVEIALSETGPVSLWGAEGGATVIMDGPGPAFFFSGTHEGTASPDSFAPEVREQQRLPMVSGLEIAGAHPQADGLRLEGLWQPTVSRVYVHDCRHGIHVVRRNRNLIIAECHIYNNSGVGVFYDHLNLHQSNIVGCHISYNAGGGIKVLESEIRNLQICGNDIEYNYDLNAPESADVWIETLSSSVREGTISGNTIQAKPSPGGANVRFRGHSGDVRQKAGNWAITGNLISSQTVNVHLQFARGVVISGNTFFSGHDRTLRVEQCECIAVGPNIIDRNPDYRVEAGDGIVFDRSVGCTVTGVIVQGARPAGEDAMAAVEVVGSSDINVTGCQVLDPTPRGICIQDSIRCRVSDCTVVDRREPRLMEDAIRVDGGRSNMIESNLLGEGKYGTVSCDEGTAMLEGNMVVE